jgi:hypothetical protein
MFGFELVWSFADLSLTLKDTLMDWTIPCKKAAALLVAREDRTLTLGEGAALRVHLWVCKACPRLEHQILTMRHAWQGWRNYREQHPDEAPPPEPQQQQQHIA